MDHLVVGIVFLLACVCIDFCVKYNMWTEACVAELERVWECVGMCVHTQDAYCQAWGQRDAFFLSF